MRFLVSGSHGLIGESLVARLRRDQHQVHRVVRGQASEGEAHIDIEKGTLDCSRLEGGSVDGIDVVVNLSGERLTPFRWSAAKRERLRTSRIAVTDILARAIAKSDQPPAVFISASAIGIYGERGESELDEQSAPGKGFLAELCRAWERASAPAGDRGIRTVHIRTAPVLAPKSPPLSLLVPLFRLGLGAHVGSGRQWTSWIAIDDVVAAIIYAALTPAIDGPCNLSSPNPVRNIEFTEELARALGRRAVLGIPRRLLIVLIGKEATSEFVLPSQRVVPRQLLDAGFQFTYPSITAALVRAVST